MVVQVARDEPPAPTQKARICCWEGFYLPQKANATAAPRQRNDTTYKLNGKLLWETELPAAGNATPSVYEIKGREFVVIVCGGGKNGAPLGSSIVAFALPEE